MNVCCFKYIVEVSWVNFRFYANSFIYFMVLKAVFSVFRNEPFRMPCSQCPCYGNPLLFARNKSPRHAALIWSLVDHYATRSPLLIAAHSQIPSLYSLPFLMSGRRPPYIHSLAFYVVFMPLLSSRRLRSRMASALNE